MTTTTYTGEDATLYISGAAHDTYAVGSFDITIDRGTSEYELTCEKGNYRTQGAMAINGTFTAAKLGNAEAGPILAAMIGGSDHIKISGNAGTNSLHFSFVSAMITGFDLTFGDADTVTEGSIDWQIKHPYKVGAPTVTSAHGGQVIKDH